MVAILDISTEQFSTYEFLCCFKASHRFSSIRLTAWEEMSLKGFQDGLHGGHLGYWNGKYLAILNLYVAPMPPIKFQLDPTYSLGEIPFEEFQFGCRGSHLGYLN